MKDHEIKQLVNDLTQIAIKFHACQQLRENIAIRVRAAFKGPVVHNFPETGITGSNITSVIRDELEPVVRIL